MIPARRVRTATVYVSFSSGSPQTRSEPSASVSEDAPLFAAKRSGARGVKAGARTGDLALEGRDLGVQLAPLDLDAQRLGLAPQRLAPARLFGRGELQLGLDDPAVDDLLALAVDPVLAVVEEGHEAVEVLLRDRVELVVVALGARERAAEPHGPRRGDPVHQRLEAVLLDVDPALLVELAVAVEAGRDLLLERRVLQHVAGELLDGEVAERQIAIERVDHPVAVLPGRAALVLLVAVRVGVAREVEPRPRPALAVALRGEQAIDQAAVGVGARVRHEGVDLLRRRRQADQVEAQAADEGLARRLRRGRHALFLEPREHEGVDRALHPARVAHRGLLRPLRLQVGPVHGGRLGLLLRGVRAACPRVDPGRDACDLRGG